MKTSLSEYIEYLEGIKERDNLPSHVITTAKNYLQQNKTEIIKAYDDAFNYVVGGGFVAKTGEQYFDEMYNDKK